MTKWKPTFESLLLLVCLLTLTGCDGSKRERNKAIAEAKKAKAELAKVKAILEQTQSERDELREYIDRISEERGNTQSKLAAVMQAQEKLQYQITEERDAAIAKAKDAQAMVERLREQLKEKVGEIRELEQWNEELQAAIQHLQNQIDQANQQLDEELYEEPNEQSEPNVIDVNDF